jgi:hypothetical protein
MKIFLEIFGHLISFYYYSFDRIVIRGYLFSLYHCSSIVYFFKELHGIKEITKQVFASRTKDYQEWVEAFARNNAIAIQWAEEGTRKEDYVKCYQNKMLRAGKTGVYFIFKSMEQEYSFIDKFDQSFHVFRTYFKNSFLKQYQKFNTFLRNELVCNDLKDFFLPKSLASLDNVKNTFKDILDRFTDFQAISLNNHFDFDILSLLSKPIRIAHTTIPGIRIDNKRLLRIMEIFLNPFYAINPWKSKDLHKSLQNAFALSPSSYTLDQLRYDIRKLKAHGIIQRIAGTYLYELTDFGKKVCILFVLFHSRIFGPMSSSLFNSLPKASHLPLTKIENAYAKIDHSLHELLQLLAA